MKISPAPRRFYILVTSLSLVALALIAGRLFVTMLSPMFTPLLLAAITALMIGPHYERLVARCGQRRYWAATIMTILVLGLLVLPVLIVIATTATELGSLLAMAKDWAVTHQVDNLSHIIAHPYVQTLRKYAETYLHVTPETLPSQAAAWASKIGATISKSTLNFISNLPATVLNMALYALGLFFFLADGKAGLRAWRQMSPLRRSHEERIWQDFQAICKSSVLGTLFSALGQAGIFLTTLLLIAAVTDVTFGSWMLLLTALTAVAAMLPVLGAALIWVPLTIYYLAASQVLAGVIMLVVGVVLISTVDNVIRAWALKGASDMHPLYGLILVIGGLNIFGPIGIFLGPIIGSLLITFLKLIAADVRGGDGAERELITRVDA